MTLKSFTDMARKQNFRSLAPRTRIIACLFLAIWFAFTVQAVGSFGNDKAPFDLPVRAALNSPSITSPEVAEAPLQAKLSRPKTFAYNGYQLTAVYSYALTGRVLRKERYSQDRESDLSPIDVAFGWQRMADPAVLSEIRITQGNRFYYWRTPDYPIPRAEIESSSANVHIIPARAKIFDQVRGLKRNQIATLKGYLVNIRHKDGFNWSSSTVRTDTGEGACEIFYVTEVIAE